MPTHALALQMPSLHSIRAKTCRSVHKPTYTFSPVAPSIRRPFIATGPSTAPTWSHHIRCSTVRAAATTEKAESGDYVEIHYVGTLDDGSEFDSSRAREQPLGFFLGAGRVVPGFEQLASGMSVGERRKERIEPAAAYGEWSESMTAKVPVANAPDGLIKGATVELQNGMQATVTDVDEEHVTIDANHPLAGKALTFDVELVKLAKAANMQTATFGAGCFWSVELAFQRLPGIVNTTVGYSQGESTDVTYEQVCSGNTGHNEVVQVNFNPTEISYEKLLEAFFDKHDPTTLNRQGNDVGTQYRSGIYYHTEEQKAVAESALNRMQEKYGGNVVTEIEPITNFCRAEEYHQQYLERGGRFGRPQSAAKGCSDPIRCYG
jgi:peptide-methionine (S)-S-oxide reductase